MDTSSHPTNTLFIAEVPHNIPEKDFVAIFQAQEGFKSARLRRDRNNHVVGFADFEDTDSSSLALETLQGYKFGFVGSGAEKGLNIHYSHNNTNTQHPTYNIRGPRHDRPHTQTSITERDSLNSHQENGTTRSQHPSLSFMPDLSPLSLPSSHPAQTQLSNTLPNYTVPNVFPQLPSDSSSTLFIEGLPSDTTEREVAHIFRPFPGYQSLRILTKESKQSPNRFYTLCFVEFDNKYQATFAMNHLQGYRFDKDDTKGLSMSYAKTERKTKPTTRGW